MPSQKADLPAKCPRCNLHMIVPLKKDSQTAKDWSLHIKNCSGGVFGPLMLKAQKKIRSFMNTQHESAKEKLYDEWNRIDDEWKNLMIVCAECFRFVFPANQKVRPCPHCKCMMEWANELVKNDLRFSFLREKKLKSR